MNTTPHPKPGDKFGRLTVLQDAGPPPGVHANSHRYLECGCACGNHTITTSAALRAGRTRSCGCLHRDMAKLRQTERLTRELNAALLNLPSWPRQEEALASLRQTRAGVELLARTIDMERQA